MKLPMNTMMNLMDRAQRIFAERFRIQSAPLLLTVLFGTICLLVPLPAQAAETPAELAVPAAVDSGLRHLLDLADPDKDVIFDPQMIAAVLDFVEAPKNNAVIYYSNALWDLTSAYHDFDVHKDLKTLVDYAFNPDIPGAATMPSSTRLFRWMDTAGEQQAHPEVGQYLGNLDSPVIFKGRQYVEITPDLNSGAYYGYNLHQILLLFEYDQRDIIITVSKQADVSEVGKKGYVLGSDSDWDYFYSGKTGLTLPALGWVRSYMYDSRGINIYDVLDPAAPRVRCAAFKWLRAGWSGINMVQKKHIHRGLRRFAATYKEIVESPLIPPAAQLADDFARIQGLSTDVLRSKMELYSKILKHRYDQGRQSSKTWIAKLFENKSYWQGLSKEEMEAAMVIEYMKHALGKTRTEEVGELLGMRR
jgi:hypothetical protein